jgi:hypothetical protein
MKFQNMPLERYKEGILSVCVSQNSIRNIATTTTITTNSNSKPYLQSINSSYDLIISNTNKMQPSFATTAAAILMAVSMATAAVAPRGADMTGMLALMT